MNYEIFGGFKIPRKPNKRSIVDTRDRYDFWHEVQAAKTGLPWARGCYVFALRMRGGALIPWYVGKTCRQGFMHECFESHKLVHYNEVIASSAGVPLLYFIARTTPGGKFKTTLSSRESTYLETLLIGMGLQRNPHLKNVSGTKFLKELHVPGLVNSRKTPRRGPASEIVSMFDP